MLLGLSLRAWVLVGLFVAAAFVIGMIYSAGVEAERGRQAMKDATDAVDASGANQAGAAGAQQAGDAHAATAARISQDAAAGRREIASVRTGPDTVGAGALVDPHLAGVVLCRVERLRDAASADAAACGTAAPGDS